MLTITINSLKNEWKQQVSDISNSILQSIHSYDNPLLDIRISETDKIYGLCGKGTFILRKMKDMALSTKEDTTIYIPLNKTNRCYQKPLWNIKHGYMFMKNPENINSLNKIIHIINKINHKYNGYIISEDNKTSTKQTHGIIGIDIPFDEPKWLNDIISGNKMSNPIIDKDGKIIFGKSRVSNTVIEKSIKFLHQKCDRFNKLYHCYLSITKNMKDPLKEFINSKCSVVIVGYDKHARIIYKDSNDLIIIDPWKQTEDIGTKRLIEIYNNLRFIKRKPEQGQEGSCTLIALSRALFMVDKNIDTINEIIPYEYLVLSNRIVSKFR